MSRMSPALPLSDSQHNRSGSSADPAPVESASALIRTTKAAKRARVSPETLRRYVAAGLVPAVRIGPKLLMFDPKEIDKLARHIDNAS